MRASSVRAWIRLARGDEAGRSRTPRHALEFARRAKDPSALCQGLALKARVLAEIGRHDEAAPLADEAVAQAATPRRPPVLLDGRPRRCACTTWAASTRPVPTGRRSRHPAGCRRPALLAASEYRDAADEYAAIGARPEEARTRLRAAVALAAEGRREDADGELERARAFYEEVGAGEYIDAAEARLAARTEL